MIQIDEKQAKRITTLSELEKCRDSLNLTDRQKEIFMMRFHRGWSYVRISIEADISVSTVQSEMNVIREKLADYK